MRITADLFDDEEWLSQLIRITANALPRAKAKAARTALAEKHGVDAGRLRAFGVGPLAPVAANDSDGNRAKNRRVELVAQ